MYITMTKTVRNRIFKISLILFIGAFFTHLLHAQKTSIYVLSNFDPLSKQTHLSSAHTDQHTPRFIGPSIGIRKTKLNSYWQIEAGYFKENHSSSEEKFVDHRAYLRYEFAPLLWKSKEHRSLIYWGGYVGGFYLDGRIDYLEYRNSTPIDVTKAGINAGWNVQFEHFITRRISISSNASLMNLSISADFERGSDPNLTPGQNERFGFDVDMRLLGIIRLGIGYKL